MNLNSILILLIVIVGMTCFLVSVIQAIFEKTWKWKALPYVIAMSPVAAQVHYHGLGLQTALAAALFLALTKLIVYLASLEAGSADQ
jgi:hypothetical protein